MQLPKEITTVTLLSKTLAFVMFLTLPFIGFGLGMRYQQMTTLSQIRKNEEQTNTIKRVPTPTPTIEDISQWKLYGNPTYQFSLQYPPSYTYEKQTSDIFLFNIAFKNTTEKDSLTNGFLLEVRKLNNLADEVTFRKWQIEGHVTDKTEKEVAITKDGYKGMQFDYIIPDESGSGKILMTTVIINTDKYTYTLDGPKELITKIFTTLKVGKNLNAEEKLCGGIAANLPEYQCPFGYTCKLDGSYPDASGTCIKN